MTAAVVSVETETRFRIRFDALPVRRNAQGHIIEGLTVLVVRPEVPWAYVVYLSNDVTYFCKDHIELERIAPGSYEQVVIAMSEEKLRFMRPLVPTPTDLST